MASVNLGVRFNLNYLARHLWNIEYVPTKAPAIILTVKNPKSTVFIYASGKLTLVGAHSEDEAKEALRKVARQIQKLGINQDDSLEQEEKKKFCEYEANNVKFKFFTITNINASMNFGSKLRIEQFAYDYKDIGASFEPEISPAVNFIIGNVHFRIFVSGQILVPKCKNIDDLHNMRKQLFQLLQDYVIV